MRILSVGHAVFAAAILWLGVLGVMAGDFAPIWQPSPRAFPGREVFVYASAAVCLAGGAGLLLRRTAAIASCVLLGYFLCWLLVFRAPAIARAPTSQDSWSGFGETAVMVAGAWTLFALLAGPWRGALRAAAGNGGLGIARRLYGVALIPFGVAHFHFAKETASLVPDWLPAHLALAYLTGAAYLAAGAAVLTGVLGRLAAALSALQIGLFTVLVWFPIMAGGAREAFAWSETVISVMLTAAAWAVADSYRGEDRRTTRGA
jgi:uncharacterized membrane protein